MKKYIAVGMVLLASLLAVPMPVAASVPTTTDGAKLVAWLETRADPDAAFDRLSKVQRQSVKSYLALDSVVPIKQGPGVDSPMVTEADEYCQYGKFYGLSAKNRLGVTLWEYWLITDRCWAGGPFAAGSVRDGAKFTYTNFRRYATNVAIFWTFKNIDLNVSGGIGYSRWSVFTQAEFQTCIFNGLGCFGAVYPWMQFVSPPPNVNYLSSYSFSGTW